MLDHWKDYFHPHEGNDHHPHAYRKGSAVALACVVALMLVLSALQTGYIRQSDRFLSSVLPSVLVDLTNEKRTSQELPKLKHNETLALAAQKKAEHMAQNGYFAHDSPSGITPWEWFEEVGYTYRNAGENLAVKFSDADKVVEAWMDSPLHRKNILENNFTEIGIATAKGTYEGRDTIFIVQMFGRPDAQELAERSSSSNEQTTKEDAEAGNQLAAADQREATTSSYASTSTQESVDTATATLSAQQGENRPSSDQRLAKASKDPENTPAPTTSEPTRLASATSGEQITRNASGSQPNTQPSPTGSETTSNQPAAQSGTAGTQTVSSIDPAVRGRYQQAISPKQQANKLYHLLGQPAFIFKVLILTLASVILLVLLLSMIVEVKKHHLKQAGYSLIAILILLSVFYFTRELLFVEPSVAGQYATDWYKLSIKTDGYQPTRS